MESNRLHLSYFFSPGLCLLVCYLLTKKVIFLENVKAFSYKKSKLKKEMQIHVCRVDGTAQSFQLCGSSGSQKNRIKEKKHKCVV